MDDLNRIADVLVCGILNRRFLPREDLVAYAAEHLASLLQAQRERDAKAIEKRAAAIEAGQDAASVSAWLARILRDEASAIRA